MYQPQATRVQGWRAVTARLKVGYNDIVTYRSGRRVLGESIREHRVLTQSAGAAVSHISIRISFFFPSLWTQEDVGFSKAKPVLVRATSWRGSFSKPVLVRSTGWITTACSASLCSHEHKINLTLCPGSRSCSLSCDRNNRVSPSNKNRARHV